MAGISVSFIVYTFFRVVSCVYDIEIVMLRYVNKNKMFYTFFARFYGMCNTLVYIQLPITRRIKLKNLNQPLFF